MYFCQCIFTKGSLRWNLTATAKYKRLVLCHIKSLSFWHLNGPMPMRTINHSQPAALATQREENCVTPNCSVYDIGLRGGRLPFHCRWKAFYKAQSTRLSWGSREIFRFLKSIPVSKTHIQEPMEGFVLKLTGPRRNNLCLWELTPRDITALGWSGKQNSVHSGFFSNWILACTSCWIFLIPTESVNYFYTQ